MIRLISRRPVAIDHRVRAASALAALLPIAVAVLVMLLLLARLTALRVTLLSSLTLSSLTLLLLAVLALLPMEHHDAAAEKKPEAVAARGRSYGFPLLLAIGVRLPAGVLVAPFHHCLLEWLKVPHSRK